MAREKGCMNTPILMIVFNRPEATRCLLAEIRKVKPKNLFVVADGPRIGNSNDQTACVEVRSIIKSGIDWQCDVKINYSETNLGCAKRVASGIDWSFSHTERLIILEDDCLPDLSFFPYCEELLERYAFDDRIGQICGTSRYFSELNRKSSYILSRYGPIWGWASWKRAWKYYDLEIKTWPTIRDSGVLRQLVCSNTEYQIRSDLYENLYNNTPNTWDYQWGYAKLINGLLSIVPTINLVENVGHINGTHRLVSAEKSITRRKMSFPLSHVNAISADVEFDKMYSKKYCGGTLLNKIARKIYNMISISINKNAQKNS